MIASLTLLLALAGPIDTEKLDEFLADRGRVGAVVGVIAGGLVGVTAGVIYAQLPSSRSSNDDPFVFDPLRRPVESMARIPATWGLLAGVALGGGVGAAIGGAPLPTIGLTMLAAPLAVSAAAVAIYFFGAVLVPIGLAVGLVVALFAGVEAGFAAGVVVPVLTALLGAAALTADSTVTMLRPPLPRPPPTPTVTPVVVPAAEPTPVDPVDVVTDTAAAVAAPAPPQQDSFHQE